MSRFPPCLLVLCLLPWLAHAQTGGPDIDPVAERQRLQAERSTLERRAELERAQCYQQFVVNSCLTEVKRREREGLADIKRQEQVLNTMERRRKGAEQLQKSEERNSLANQETGAVQRERRVREQQERDARAVTKAQEKPKGAPAPAKSASKPLTSPATRASNEAENRKVFDRKQQEAADHRADVEKRRKERTTPLAAPLPAYPASRN